MSDKFKGLVADDALFYAVLVVLVGLVAFGLGRHSVTEQGRTAPIVQIVEGSPAAVVTRTDVQENVPATAIDTVVPSTASIVGVVASRSGTKYHLPTCGGAKQIKEANLIRFASIDLARAAGYEPAKNCPGLQ